MPENDSREVATSCFTRRACLLAILWTCAAGTGLTLESIVDYRYMRSQAVRAYEAGKNGEAWAWDAATASSSFPRESVAQRAIAYGAIWFLGLGGIFLATRHLRRHVVARNQSECQLRESREQFHEIVDSLPGVVYQYVLRPDGTHEFPYISEGVFGLLGVTPKAIEQDPEAFFPGMLHKEEDPEAIFESIRQSARDLTMWQREMRVRAAGGEAKWIQASSCPHLLSDGSVLWNGAFFDMTKHKETENAVREARDLLEQRVAERTAELDRTNRDLQKEIAERKQAERWLLQSEERFRGYFELGWIGMAVLSPDRDWLEVNGRFHQMLCTTDRDLIETTWDDLTHEDDRAAEKREFNRVLSGRSKGYTMEKRFIRRDGKVIYTSVSVRCLHNADGEIDSFLTMVEDITNRKRPGKALGAPLGNLEAPFQTGPAHMV